MKHIYYKFLLGLATLLLSSALWAQDIIITINAQKIEAKILEVSKSEIKYKESDNLDGPTFVLETAEISSIIYANGKVVLYNQSSQNQDIKPDKVQTIPEKKETNEISQTLKPGEDYNVEILLMSGQVINGKIMERADTYVAYTLNAKYYTIPATQVYKVTDIRNGEVTIYNGQNRNTYIGNNNSQNFNYTKSQVENHTYNKEENQSCYQGYLEISGFITSLPKTNNDNILYNRAMGGFGIDAIGGRRFNKKIFLGAGTGLYPQFYALKDYFSYSSLQTPVFVDLRLFIPTRNDDLYPYFNTSLGPIITYYNYYNFAYAGEIKTDNNVSVAAFFRLNAGIAYKRFSFGVGYELWGDSSSVSNYGFARIGILLGKII